MRSHGQRMAERFREHESQWFCFLTKIHDMYDTVDAVLEPDHPLLKRPRIVVTCPFGADVAEIKGLFSAKGWDGPVYESWFAKNGIERRIERGDLTCTLTRR